MPEALYGSLPPGLRAAVAGHQPPALGGYGADVAARLEALARDWIARRAPAEVVSGMAAGWDMAMAAASVALGVPLVAALACEGQGRAWPPEARARFEDLLGRAALVHVMPGGPGMWAKRDAWVLARGEVVAALWNGDGGSGTGRAVAKARRMGRPVDNLWASWSVSPAASAA